MKTIIIKKNDNQIISLSDEERENVVKIVLVNEKHSPIAWYEFDKEILKHITSIKYQTNDIRIKFEGITPSMSYEICPLS